MLFSRLRVPLFLLSLLPFVSSLPLLPVIDFTNQPANNPKTIALTFDDGFDTDGSASTYVLDTLDKYKVPGAFFINSINYGNLNTDPIQQTLLRRIHNSGYEIASHTVHHPILPQLTVAQLHSEMDDLQASVNKVLGVNYPLTMFRAPYGDPYSALGTPETKAYVHGVLGQYGVHVGWSFDSLDSNTCVGNATCVFNSVKSSLDNGNWGIVLMHSTLGSTVKALPQIIEYAKSKGYTFITVEEVIRQRYGYTSAELYNLYRVQGKRVAADKAPYFPPGDDSQAPTTNPVTPPPASTTTSTAPASTIPTKTSSGSSSAPSVDEQTNPNHKPNGLFDSGSVTTTPFSKNLFIFASIAALISCYLF